MKIINLNISTKSLSVLFSILILLSKTNSLMLENNARLNLRNTEKGKKSNSTEQNYLNPQIVQNLPKMIYEADNKLIETSTSDSNNSYNSNNNGDSNFHKLYDRYESVNIIRSNFNPEASLIASPRARIDNSFDYVIEKDNVIPKIISNHNVEIISTNKISPPPGAVRVPNFCPCAQKVRCRPCNVLANIETLESRSVFSDCPCAPKPKCPALSDQRMANGLKNLSGRISKALDLIIKQAGDIVKYEKEAVEASKKMEEASLKAQIARNNMISASEKARFIAKTGIVDRNPCNPAIAPCFSESEQRMEFFNEKIFPEEVDNIKSYMTDSIKKKMNGFTSGLNLSPFKDDDEIAKFSRGNTYYDGKRFLNNGYGSASGNSGFLKQESDDEKSLMKHREKKAVANKAGENGDKKKP